MSNARDRERYDARLRAQRREERRARAALPVCRRCWEPGHEKADCKAVLLLWTNGPDVMIAGTAERCARIFNDPLGPDSDEDLYSMPAAWKRVDGASVTLNGVSLAPADWADLYGEGFLVVDGELAPRDPR